MKKREKSGERRILNINPNCIFLIFFLILNVPLVAQVEGFSFESDIKNESTNYTKRLKKAVDQNDNELLKDVLSSNPKLVDAASFKKKAKFYPLQNEKIHLINDASILYLEGRLSLDFIAKVLDFKPNLYNSYNGLTPLYTILKYLCSSNDDERQRALSLFNLLVENSDIDLNRRYKSQPPPLSFLLGGSYKNHGDFSFIPNTVIDEFLEAKVDIQTRDDYENTLLHYSLNTGYLELFRRCLISGLSFSDKNQSNQDGLYFAISSDKINVVETLFESGYKINLYGLENLKNALSVANSAIFKKIAYEATFLIKDYKSFKKFLSVFPNHEKRLFDPVISSNWIDNFKTNDYPKIEEHLGQLIKTFNNEKKATLLSLKKRYYLNPPTSEDLTPLSGCRIYDTDMTSIYIGNWSGECRTVYNKDLKMNYSVAYGYGKFHFTKGKNTWSIEGNFYEGKLDGLSITNSRTRKIFEYFKDGKRDGIYIAKMLNRIDRNYPVMFLMSFQEGQPLGNFGIALYDNGQVSKLNHESDGYLSTTRTNYGNHYPIKLLIEGSKCYLISQLSKLGGVRGRGILTSIFTSVLKDENFQLENIALDQLQITIQNQLRIHGYNDLADIVSVVDFLECVFN